MRDPRATAVCVLGCRPTSEALARRVTAAAAAYLAGRGSMVVACGGRAWSRPGARPEVEADAMAAALVRLGVDARAIVRERCSLDTRDNARFAATMLARRGVDRVLVVTCEWHLPRALRLFGAAGLDATGHGVPRPDTDVATALFLRARETVSWWKDARKPVRVG